MSKESRQAYIEKLEAKLGEWSVDIDKLKAKAESSEAKIQTNPATSKPHSTVEEQYKCK